jgi:predicted aldo/keto reductase-like oxidoreductase
MLSGGCGWYGQYAADAARSGEEGALYKTARSSLETLGMADGVDLLTIHGVNIRTHLDAVLAPGGSLDQIELAKQHGLAKAIGFAAHVHCADIVRIIETGRMEYVNLHYGFFSSYTNVDNQPAVLAAAERGMGIYCISPANQGGELHKPPPKLME